MASKQFTGKSERAVPCVMCQAEEAKYKCPGCRAQTCSLMCCTAHKKTSGCSGKRSREEFVATSDYDEKSMMSDYRLLEEVSDLHSGLQSARRRLEAEDKRACPPTPSRGKKGCQELLNKAARARVHLKFMPTGMQRHKTNTSYFSRRDQCIYWHLEIRFPLVQVTVHLERVQASTTIQQVLNTAFSWKDGQAARAVRLSPFIDATPAECEVYLQREQVPSPHDRMKQLSTGETVEDSLTGECVIEYPVFVVQLPCRNTPDVTAKPAHHQPLLQLEANRVLA